MHSFSVDLFSIYFGFWNEQITFLIPIEATANNMRDTRTGEKRKSRTEIFDILFWKRIRRVVRTRNDQNMPEDMRYDSCVLFCSYFWKKVSKAIVHDSIYCESFSEIRRTFIGRLLPNDDSLNARRWCNWSWKLCRKRFSLWFSYLAVLLLHMRLNSVMCEMWMEHGNHSPIRRKIIHD